MMAIKEKALDFPNHLYFLEHKIIKYKQNGQIRDLYQRILTQIYSLQNHSFISLNEKWLKVYKQLTLEQIENLVKQFNIYFLDPLHGMIFLSHNKKEEKLQNLSKLESIQKEKIQDAIASLITQLESILKQNQNNTPLFCHLALHSLGILKLALIDDCIILNYHDYYLKFENFKIKQSVNKILVADKLKLQSEIDLLFQNVFPSQFDMNEIEITQKRLQLILNANYGQKQVLFLYGSAINGLFTKNNSDIDMTVIFQDNFQKDHIKILQQIENRINYKFKSQYSKPKLITAKRLILLRFKDNVTNMQIDLSVNNILGIYNSQLINRYCMIDTRYLKLCHFLKHLNKKKFPNEMRRLTSYAFYLMLLVFFQQVKPQVLPQLQLYSKKQPIQYNQQYKLFGGKYLNNEKSISQKSTTVQTRNQNENDLFNEIYETDVGMLSLEEGIALIEKQSYKNQKTEAQLLLEFLQFLLEFPFKNQVFDVPNGCFQDKKQVKFNNQNMDLDNDPTFHPYFIIDPFDINHNPGKKVKFNDSLFAEYSEYFRDILRKYSSNSSKYKVLLQEQFNSMNFKKTPIPPKLVKERDYNKLFPKY